MDHSNRSFRGSKSEYTLGKPLKDGKGGEGTVYSIKGHPRKVAKIYHDMVISRPSAEVNMRRRKLECMLSHSVQTTYRGKLRIAWPQDILYDGSQMVGYVMPRVKSSRGLYEVWMQERQDTAIRKYNWRKSVRVARSLAQIVADLHKSNVIVGDFNPKNFLVDRAGNVIFVDTDSYDITDPKTGERFPCQVARAEMLAPELQGVRNLSTDRAPFSRSTDRFSLAVLIFRLLMGGFHPFGCVCVSGAVSSSAGINEQTEIVNGHCAYVRDIPDRKISPLSPKLDFLTEDVRRLFIRTFSYSALTARSNIPNRASAEEWVSVLENLYKQNFRRCRADRRHVFPGHNKTCPFCGKKRRSRIVPVLLAAAAAVMLTQCQNNAALSIPAAEFLDQGGGWISGIVSAAGDWGLQIADYFEALFPENGEHLSEVDTIPETTAESEITGELDFLLPSDQRILTKEDVEGMTRYDVQLAINEIYARYGRDFTGSKYGDYFQAQSWYSPRNDLSDSDILSMLTPTEWENLQFLIRYRNKIS